jgi:hypothetical protein
MKIKEYLNSLVSRRKRTTSSKSDKSKSHFVSIPSTDCHYEICGYEDPNKILINNDQHSRTQVLLNRHAQLINTIVGIRSQQDNSCSNYRIPHKPEQENIILNRNYSSTLASSNPRRQCQHQTLISSSNISLAIKTRQRSKIRTNPWIKTIQISKPEYSIYDPTLSTGLIHSESFPQTISNGNINLHQSDSGRGFSLSSSRAIESSSPDNTSSDGPLVDEKQHISYKNHIEQYYPPKTNSFENKRRVKNRYQHPSNTRISSPKRSSINRSSSPRVYNDHFSIEFEEIVENERLQKQRSPKRNSPFILPLDEIDVKLISPPLKKTNSHTILKHIEEIENEIRMIKNLNLDPDEQILSSNIYSNEDERQSIHEQVDQWVEECLTIPKINPTIRLHNECDHLSNTIKDYVVCVYSNNNHQTSSLPKPEKTPELLTTFYLSSIPLINRTFSLIDQSLQLPNSQTIKTSDNLKSIHECPF